MMGVIIVTGDIMTIVGLVTDEMTIVKLTDEMTTVVVRHGIISTFNNEDKRSLKQTFGQTAKESRHLGEGHRRHAALAKGVTHCSVETRRHQHLRKIVGR